MINVTLQFDGCNEPLHKDYDVDGDKLVIITDPEVPMQVLDGDVYVRAKATAGNLTDKDFVLSANINLKDYSIQRKAGNENRTYMSADLSVSLKTEDSDKFSMNIGGETATKNIKTGGFVKAAISAKGVANLSQSFDLGAYDLAASGSMIDYSVSKNQSFVFYTIDNLVSSGPTDRNNDAIVDGKDKLVGFLPHPSSGKFGFVVDGEESVAEVVADGLNIDATLDGVTEKTFCSWELLEKYLNEGAESSLDCPKRN